jgi:phosphopantothenoylcysteine decarboxylase/phosphopantothenate--cysteine ligase
MDAMAHSFSNKHIVIAVAGGIAAYKVAGWASSLVKEQAVVDVVMTEAAKQFISPLTFSSLTGRAVFDDMFTAERSGRISHISLGREADCLLVAPATANTIAHLAGGQADNLVTTSILAATIPIIVCPAMNVKMYEHRATRNNIALLREYGYEIVEPETGAMACGDFGPGRLPTWEIVSKYVLRKLTDSTLAGHHVLVTAGPTREHLDPARYLSNRSSGKMGYALALEAFYRGAAVTLISGPTTLPSFPGIELVEVETAQEMHDTVMSRYQQASIIIKGAAVADFRAKHQSAQKIKKQDATYAVELEPTADILAELGRRCDMNHQILIGFAAESENLESEARRKLVQKNCHLIAVNSIVSPSTGFGADTNQVTLVHKKGATPLPLTSKEKTAELMFDYIEEHFLPLQTG